MLDSEMGSCEAFFTDSMCLYAQLTSRNPRCETESRLRQSLACCWEQEMCIHMAPHCYKWRRQTRVDATVQARLRQGQVAPLQGCLFQQYSP